MGLKNAMELLDKVNVPLPDREQFKSKVKSPKFEDWREQRKIKSSLKKNEVFRPDTLLLVVDGADTRPIWADKEADDQRLLYEEDGKAQECKITSKPLEVEGTHVYFTRDGFKGTMALNKDTLLDADVYKRTEDGNNNLGEIEELTGSKATLRKSNEAIRERKLLTPQKMAKGKLLMAIGTGTALGLVLATQLGI